MLLIKRNLIIFFKTGLAQDRYKRFRKQVKSSRVFCFKVSVDFALNS